MNIYEVPSVAASCELELTRDPAHKKQLTDDIPCMLRDGTTVLCCHMIQPLQGAAVAGKLSNVGPHALQAPIAGTSSVSSPPVGVVSKATLLQVSMAGDMATWLVAHSQMHPDFSDLPVMYDMTMGGFEDPTTRNTASRFEGLILQLQVCCAQHKHAAALDQ